MIGTGIYAPTADNYNLFSETSITAEAASVGKVTGLKSNTLSNSKIKLKWKRSGAQAAIPCICVRMESIIR